MKVTETFIKIHVVKKSADDSRAVTLPLWLPSSPEGFEKFKSMDVTEIKLDDPKLEVRKDVTSYAVNNISLSEIADVELRTCGGDRNSGKITFYNKNVRGGWFKKLFSKIAYVEFTRVQEDAFLTLYEKLKPKISA